MSRWISLDEVFKRYDREAVGNLDALEERRAESEEPPASERSVRDEPEDER